MNIYSPGQASVLFSVWHEKAEWFIIGGPANGNEAQTVVERYPHIKCVGFEPDPIMYKKQLELGFPGELYKYALWCEDGEAELKIPQGGRHIGSSLCRKEITAYEGVQVRTRTLDSLEEELGPWNNIVLWMDIECAELEALYGCKRLLREEKILMVNVEIFEIEKHGKISAWLNKYELRQVKNWNNLVVSGHTMFDAIYRVAPWPKYESLISKRERRKKRKRRGKR